MDWNGAEMAGRDKSEMVKGAIIEAEDLSLSYDGKTPVVSDVSFSIAPGEIFCVVGESGCGKSTLLKAIQNPDLFGITILNGTISKSFRPGEDPGGREGAGKRIGMIFQNPGASFNPIRTYRKQFYETLKSNGLYRGEKSGQEILRMFQALQLLDGERILDSCPYEMSGGMNQRIAIALIMLLRPELILADEPTSALDSTLQKQVLEELLRARDLSGTSILLVTHNLGVASKMADRVAVMREGRFVECGPAGRVLRFPEHPYTKELLGAVPQLRCARSSASEWKRPSEPLLEVRHIEKKYRRGRHEIQAVRDISFTLQEGECLGIVGESGSGKSTLLRQISGLEKPDGGEIRLCGKPLSPKRTREDYQRMQMIFQEPSSSFDPRIRLGKSILENGKNLRRLTGAFEKTGKTRKQMEEVLAELLRQTGLSPDLKNRYPSQISGGQCQRAAIARAIAVHPMVLLCDEITSALDVSVQARMIECLTELAQKEGMAIVFVSHDLALVGSICSQILVMKEGACVEYERTDRILRTPQAEYTKQLLGAVLPVC